MYNVSTFLKDSIMLSLYDDRVIDKIRDNISWKIAFMCIYFVSFLVYTLFFLFQVLVNEMSRSEAVIIFLITLAILPLVYFLFAGVIHLLMKLFGGQADFSQTFKFWLSFVFVWNIVFVLFMGVLFLESLITDLTFSFVLISTFNLFFFLFFIWYLGAIVNTFSKVHNVSLVKGFLALIVIPLVTIIILSIFISVISLILGPNFLIA